MPHVWWPLYAHVCSDVERLLPLSRFMQIPPRNAQDHPAQRLLD